MPRTAKVVAFSTTPDMAEEIDRLAAEEGRTRSELLREAVRCYRRARIVEGSHAAEARAAYPSPPAAALSLPGLARVLAARQAIAHACRTAGVARLWVYGSAVRDDFDPARSDFDFIVEFGEGAPRKPFLGELFELQGALSQTLGSPADVGEVGAIKNPRVRAAADAEKVLVYEQP